MILGAALLTFGVLWGTAETAAAKNRIAIDFQKSPVSQTKWSGAGMSHDFVPVNVDACLLGVRVAGHVTHVTSFTFIFSTPENSASVDMTGSIDPKGRIVLNGVVSSSTFPTVPRGTRSQLRAQADAGFNVMGTIYLTVP
jgi:hypothetical protein